LQKRPIILRSLPIVATPYFFKQLFYIETIYLFNTTTIYLYAGLMKIAPIYISIWRATTHVQYRWDLRPLFSSIISPINSHFKKPLYTQTICLFYITGTYLFTYFIYTYSSYLHTHLYSKHPLPMAAGPTFISLYFSPINFSTVSSIAFLCSTFCYEQELSTYFIEQLSLIFVWGGYDE